MNKLCYLKNISFANKTYQFLAAEKPQLTTIEESPDHTKSESDKQVSHDN
jgi:hypothetical protein